MCPVQVGRAKEGSTINPGDHYDLGERGYCCCRPDGQWSIALRVLPGDPEWPEDYDAGELLAIARSMLEKQELKLSPGAEAKMAKILEGLAARTSAGTPCGTRRGTRPSP